MRIIKLFVVAFTVTLTIGNAAAIYKPTTAAQYKILNARDKSISCHFTTDTISTQKSILNEYHEAITLSMNGNSKQNLKPGVPELPLIEKLIAIPKGGEISLKIDSISSVIILQKEVAPYQLPLSQSGQAAPFAYDSASFAIEQYPAAPLFIKSIEQLGDVRVARIAYAPLSYMPKTKQILLHSDIYFTLNCSEKIDRETKIKASLQPFYKEVLNLNHQRIKREETVPTYLIIGNSTTLAQVEELRKWKIQKGLHVITADVTEIGATTTAIDAYIESVYDTTAGLLFVLLCGDEKIIPSFRMNCPYSYVACPSDNTYGVVGYGRNPSIYVGRITHADKTMDAYGYQAWKIVEHESNPDEGQWMEKAMTWGCSQPNGNPTASYWQSQLQNAGMSCSKELESTGAKKGAQLIQSFNQGLSTFAMKGHGNDQSWHSAQLGIGSWGFASVETMDIGRRFSWINNIACLNSRFEYSSYTCFAEQMMAYGSIDEAKGCLGMYSFTVSSSGGSPTQAADGMLTYLYKALFEEDMKHVGVAAAYGTMMSGSDADKQSSMLWGCPETDIYFSYPLNQFQVSPTAPVPGETYEFSTGIAGALVSLVSKDYEPIASGYADENGDISLNLPTYNSATILTITARNTAPFITEFEEVHLTQSEKPLNDKLVSNVILSKNRLQLQTKSNTDLKISIIDNLGRTLYREKIHPTNGVVKSVMKRTLATGVYLVIAESKNERSQLKCVVK